MCERAIPLTVTLREAGQVELFGETPKQLGAARFWWRPGKGVNHFCHCDVERKRRRIRRVKYWEIIADRLSKAGWSLGWVSAIDSQGRTTWIADAHRGDGSRFIVRAEEMLTAFVELQSAIHEFAVDLIS